MCRLFAAVLYSRVHAIAPRGKFPCSCHSAPAPLSPLFPLSSLSSFPLLLASLAEKQRELDSLYAKMGQRTQFKNVEERDNWLKAGIAELQGILQKKAAEVG